MFYLTYIYRELRRRLGRTVLTVLGLALGVGLVASVTSVADGLDEAQKQVLDPLGGIGTDLIVTRPVETQQEDQAQAAEAPGEAPRRGIGVALGGLSAADQQALFAENQSIITDLSKLGKPGERFVHDFFLPGTQLTFPSEQAVTVTAIDGVSKVAQGLTLVAVHQEGTVPEIVAEIQTGGEAFEVSQAISPPTPEEEEQIRACQEKARAGAESGGLRSCLPERFRNFRAQFRTPARTIRQALNPPQTDITSNTYTISGVDMSVPGLSLLTPNQMRSGKYFSTQDAKEAVLNDAYAGRKNLKIGDELDLNGSKFKIVGLARPPLGGQAADVYLPLGELQKLAGREGRANVLLVRAESAGRVDGLEKEIGGSFAGGQVSSAEELANQVTGSLVDAGNLADRLGVVVSVVMLVASFLMASLLTLSSVSKRVRELGTLKAIGWKQSLVVRQVIGESLAQGLLGGVVGVGIGIAGALVVARLAPPLEATAAPGGGGSFFGLGGVTSAAEQVIQLQASINPSTIVLALGLALLGGLIAGTVGALRAARLRPAEALREIG